MRTKCFITKLHCCENAISQFERCWTLTNRLRCVNGGKLKNTLKIALMMVSMLWLELAAAQTDSPKLSARVPFVACRSDGQTGPVEAPMGKSKVLPLSARTAQQLAYYQTKNGFGVLAPRGWYCFGTYGSAGDTLYVSPQPIATANLFTSTWTGF